MRKTFFHCAIVQLSGYLIKSLLLFLLLLSSCSSSDNEEPIISEEPFKEELKEEYNDSNYGSYKGVIVGSSGTIRLFIAKNYVKAYLDFGDLKDTLTTANTFPDKQQILNATFSGKYSSMKFNVAADGSNPQLVDITIDGHESVQGIIAKETTSQEVRCFEGTFSGDDSGTFNCIIFGSSIIGIFKSNQTDTSGQVNGTVNGNDLSADSEGSTSSGASFEGTITTDACTGTWFNSIEYTDDEGNLVVITANGEWQGVRTL